MAQRVKRSLALVALASTLAHARPSHACTCAPLSEIHDSVPVDGQVDVPTNVAPWLVGVPAQLVDAEGLRVPVRASTEPLAQGTCTFIYELIPEAPLAPNSRYSLVLESGADDETADSRVSFTTGAGPSNVEVPATHGSTLAVQELKLQTNCDYGRFLGKLTTQYAGLVEVRVPRDGNMVRYLERPDGLTFLELGSEAGPGCAEVRGRDIVGHVSAPETLCYDTADAEPVGLEYLQSAAEATTSTKGSAQSAQNRAETPNSVAPADNSASCTLTPRERSGHKLSGLLGLWAIVTLQRRRRRAR